MRALTKSGRVMYTRLCGQPSGKARPCGDPAADRAYGEMHDMLPAATVHAFLIGGSRGCTSLRDDRKWEIKVESQQKKIT